MGEFPRTTVGGLSVSRMVIGTNWFLGYTHSTEAKDRFVMRTIKKRKAIADVLEAFLKRGVDTVMCPTDEVMYDAVREAQDRTGSRMIVVATPTFEVNERTAAEGFDLDEVRTALDYELKNGAAICLPHSCVTDMMLDKCTRQLRQMDTLCAEIRQRGMIPGLSTHAPETVVYADETNLDVETYIQLFNPMGFMMHVEPDWGAKIINEAKKPVMVIKSMAAGQIHPFQAMTFVWNVIKSNDMVTVGTTSPEEADDIVNISLGVLGGHAARTKLQHTRSKASMLPKEE
jgi:hypothetical protein